MINIDLKTNEACGKTRSYLNMLNSNTFHNLIDLHTRITPVSRTTIDHVYSNVFKYKSIPGIVKCALTDNYPIFVILKHSKRKVDQTNHYTRSLKEFNSDNFNSDLKASLDKLLSDSPNLDEKNFDQSFSAFVQVIKLAINRHAPLKKLSRRQKRLNKKPWITKGILISIKKKQKLHRTHFLGPNPIERDIYKKYSNVLTRVKTASIKIYFHKAIHDSKNSPQKTWDVLR